MSSDDIGPSDCIDCVSHDLRNTNGKLQPSLYEQKRQKKEKKTALSDQGPRFQISLVVAILRFWEFRKIGNG